MTSPLLAALVEADLPIRILASIGGGAVGALLLGFCLQLLVKLGFGQNVPSWVLWPVRALGGVACGLLVWSLLGGGGGLGLGGGGGGGTGKGGEKDTPKEKKDREKAKEKGKDTGVKDHPPPPQATLRIEVLGDPDLERIAGGKFDSKKRYRVPGRPELFTLAEAEGLIRKRRTAKPPLRHLEVVLYRNSPAQDKEQVTALVGYAEDLGGKDGEKLVVSYTVHRDQDAPVE